MFNHNFILINKNLKIFSINFDAFFFINIKLKVIEELLDTNI